MFEEMLKYESRQNSEKYNLILKELESNDECRIYEGITNLCAELSLAEENQV